MITTPRLAACLAGFLRLGWGYLPSSPVIPLCGQSDRQIDDGPRSTRQRPLICIDDDGGSCRRTVIEPGTASDGIRSSQGPLKLSLSTGKCTSARRDYGFESALLRRPLPSNGKRAEMDSGTGSQVAFIVHRAGHGVIFALPRCSTHSKDTWRFRHGASVNSEEGGDPCFSSAV